MELKQIAKQNGFTHRVVSQSEREDGVGVVVGDNFVKAAGTKNAVWYTEEQMIQELKLAPVQVKSVTLDASVGLKKAEQMAVEWAKSQSATWWKIERCQFAFGGKAISTCLHYGI